MPGQFFSLRSFFFFFFIVVGTRSYSIDCLFLETHTLIHTFLSFFHFLPRHQQIFNLSSTHPTDEDDRRVKQKLSKCQRFHFIQDDCGMCFVFLSPFLSFVFVAFQFEHLTVNSLFLIGSMAKRFVCLSSIDEGQYLFSLASLLSPPVMDPFSLSRSPMLIFLAGAASTRLDSTLSINWTRWWTYLDRWEKDKERIDRSIDHSVQLLTVLFFNDCLLCLRFPHYDGSFPCWLSCILGNVLLFFLLRTRTYTNPPIYIHRWISTEKNKKKEEEGEEKGDTGCISMKEKRGLSWLCTRFLLSSVLLFLLSFSPSLFPSPCCSNETSSHLRRSPCNDDDDDGVSWPLVASTSSLKPPVVSR